MSAPQREALEALVASDAAWDDRLATLFEEKGWPAWRESLAEWLGYPVEGPLERDVTLAGKRAPLWEHIDRALDERARRNELAEAFLELSTRPGDVAAVDWLLTMVCVAKNVRGLHRLRDVGDGRRCRIDLEAEWDAVLTKALDEDEPATQRFIHHTLEAERDRVERALAPFLSTRLLLDGWARAGLGELPSAVTPSSM